MRWHTTFSIAYRAVRRRRRFLSQDRPGGLDGPVREEKRTALAANATADQGLPCRTFDVAVVYVPGLAGTLRFALTGIPGQPKIIAGTGMTWMDRIHES
jgi:hypothetical protein